MNLRFLTTLLMLASLLLMASCARNDPAPATSSAASGDPRPELETSDVPMRFSHDTLQGLAAASPLIFVGRVAEQTTERDSRGLIITHTTFTIDRMIVGEERATHTLTTLGGTLGDEILQVAQLPEFAPDQTYIIFTDASRTTYDPVTANKAGVFLVGPRNDVYNYSGVSVASVDRGHIQLGGTVLEGRGPLESQGVAPVVGAPETGGEALTLEGLALQPAMSLDAFIEAVQEAAR